VKTRNETLVRRLRANLDKANTSEPRYELLISVGAARLNRERPLALGEHMAEADGAMCEESAASRNSSSRGVDSLAAVSNSFELSF
jgi:hypothetical protein